MPKISRSTGSITDRIARWTTRVGSSKGTTALALCVLVAGCHHENVGNVATSNPTTRNLTTTTTSRGDDSAVEVASAKLRSENIEICIAGARELGEHGDERAVPVLLAALKPYTSPYRGVGGAEQGVPVRIYRKELVTSISKLTGLSFDFPGEPERFTGAPPRSYDQVGRLNRVVEATERWLREKERKEGHSECQTPESKKELRQKRPLFATPARTAPWMTPGGMMRNFFVLGVLVLFGGCETHGNRRHAAAEIPIADDGPHLQTVDRAIKQLEASDIEVRTQATRQLGELRDERALPALIAALRAATSPYLGIGGTEQAIPGRKYRKELVASIEKLTGLRFDFPGEPDRYGDHPPPSYDEPRRLNGVIDASEAWMNGKRGAGTIFHTTPTLHSRDSWPRNLDRRLESPASITPINSLTA